MDNETNGGNDVQPEEAGTSPEAEEGHKHFHHLLLITATAVHCNRKHAVGKET